MSSLACFWFCFRWRFSDTRSDANARPSDIAYSGECVSQNLSFLTCPVESSIPENWSWEHSQETERTEIARIAEHGEWPDFDGQCNWRTVFALFHSILGFVLFSSVTGGILLLIYCLPFSLGWITLPLSHQSWHPSRIYVGKRTCTRESVCFRAGLASPWVLCRDVGKSQLCQEMGKWETEVDLRNWSSFDCHSARFDVLGDSQFRLWIKLWSRLLL
jgi:hypothetical protein